MLISIKRPLNYNGEYRVFNVESVNFSDIGIMAIDGSTSSTGIAIFGQSDCSIQYIINIVRQKGEEPVRYKLRLKKFVNEILKDNRNIQQVYYEEPVIDNIAAVKNLFMLRSFIDEMIIENEPDLNYLKHYEISNMRWKKQFLLPNKVPLGSENQKKAVRDKLLEGLPFLCNITQDEVDAICLGFVVTRHIMYGDSGGDAEELTSKKKVKRFKYNVQFIPADDEEDAIVAFGDVYEGPLYILQNGICITSLGNRENFDKHIFEEMGEEDKILIIKFDPAHHGNVVLQYRIGNLVGFADYMFAVVWRRTRKY